MVQLMLPLEASDVSWPHRVVMFEVMLSSLLGNQDMMVDSSGHFLLINNKSNGLMVNCTRFYLMCEPTWPCLLRYSEGF